MAWLCNVQKSFSTDAEDTKYPGHGIIHMPIVNLDSIRELTLFFR